MLSFSAPCCRSGQRKVAREKSFEPPAPEDVFPGGRIRQQRPTILFRYLNSFSFRFFRPQPLRPLCLRRKCAPGRLGTAATLAHVIKRCRFKLIPRLLGTSKVELKSRASDDGCRHYSASWPFVASAWSVEGSSLVGSVPADSSADFKFTALILPRLSCWRS